MKDKENAEDQSKRIKRIIEDLVVKYEESDAILKHDNEVLQD